MYTQTAVQPRRHFVDNFGPNVQAVTFAYNGQVHSINRRGKRNILGFVGADGTYTFTNGQEKFLRMPRGSVTLISWTNVNGETTNSFAHI